MGNAEAESGAVLRRFLDHLQRDRRIRMGFGFLLIAILLAVAVRSAYGLLPHHYALTISGGEIVSNRHYLARLLAREAQREGLDLIVRPERDTFGALEAVSRGAIDVAFVQGGIDETFPNVEHVAMVTVEYVHLLVKSGLKGISDLKGKRINLGPKPSAPREIGLKIMQFAGYVENADYIETNYSAEDLLAFPDEKLPDAVFTVSTSPSYLVEILVRERSYQLMEIVFPQSLALREGWAGIGKLLAYTYSLSPAVPDHDISTVAVNMYLVANAKADPAAVEKLLEVLYSQSIASALRTRFDDTAIGTPSGYPISEGTELYRKRNDSIFTQAMWSRLQGVFGLVMTFGGVLLVLVKWFRGPEPQPVFDDAELHGYLEQVAGIERKLTAMEASRALDAAELRASRDLLGDLRVKLLERYPTVKLKDAQLFDRCVASVQAGHERTRTLLAEVGS
jgi:TRAP-type uncharacterized transport system substrate-binding protein